MLAILLWTMIGIEAVVNGLLVARAGASGAAALGLVVLHVVLFRVFMVGLLFLIAWVWRMKRPVEARIGPLATMRLLAAEWLAFALLFTFFQPCERLLGQRRPRASANAQSTEIPVIFVHGFLCNGGYFWPLLRYLRDNGRSRLYTINTEPPFTSIDRYAQQLARRVDEVLAETGAEKVVLVGHSMGGLTSRAYVQRLGGAAKVARIITLGTPHHGTAHGLFMPVTNAVQMRPNSAWINALNAELPLAVPLTSIMSYHDNLLGPQDSALHPTFNNICLPGIGHLEMSFSREIQRLVLAELREVAG